MISFTLLADEIPLWLSLFTRPETLIFMIPIVGIIGGVAVSITSLVIRHRERMAKIQQGIDPDAERKA